MRAIRSAASWSETLNDLDPHLPKGRGVCFDVGISGNCGVLCPAFVDGDCEEPQEFSRAEVLAEHCKEDAEKIFELYACFRQQEGCEG